MIKRDKFRHDVTLMEVLRWHKFVQNEKETSLTWHKILKEQGPGIWEGHAPEHVCQVEANSGDS